MLLLHNTALYMVSDFSKYNFRCETPIEPCNEISIMDSIKIPDSVKKKIHAILVKHENGILCNDFMDIYEVSTGICVESFYIRVYLDEIDRYSYIFVI